MWPPVNGGKPRSYAGVAGLTSKRLLPLRISSQADDARPSALTAVHTRPQQRKRVPRRRGRENAGLRVKLCVAAWMGDMSLASPAAAVWPVRDWPLAALSKAQYASWLKDGYLVVPNAVPLELATNAAKVIREYVGADPHNRSTWYANVLDIYEDRDVNGKRPHHGPAGMAQMYHHASLWALRQHPRLHQIFSDIYGTHRLFVTVDRAHFKPPEDVASFPAWSDPGAVHKGLHWDVNTLPSNWPVPFVVQGVLYLEDTPAEQGALRVVPGFHRRLEAWSAAQPSDRNAERPEGAAARALEDEAVAVGAPAGSLVLWHSLLPHGPAPNRGQAPRVSAYVTMLPVDAAPFLGERRRLDTPLGMSDAGTLAYLPEMQVLEGIAVQPEPREMVIAGTEAKRAEDEQSAQGNPEPTCEGEGSNGTIPTSALRRQSRERRAERWRKRLPMLDEDPREEELSRRPPGEEAGEPVPLSPLGERLAGVVEWEIDSATGPAF